MNKTELVAAIAERTELTKKDADQALKAFIDVVGDELSKGEKLSLIHISEPTRPRLISYAVFCLKKFFFNDTATTEIYTV